MSRLGICAIFFIAIISLDAFAQSGYDQLLIKSRASRYEEQEGKSDSGDLYIYADDKKVSKELEDARKIKGNARFTAPINIIVPKIGKDDRIRNVNIAIESKKEIKIDTGGSTGGDKPEVNIGRAEIEKGTKVRDVNILIDAQRGINVK